MRNSICKWRNKVSFPSSPPTRSLLLLPICTHPHLSTHPPRVSGSCAPSQIVLCPNTWTHVSIYQYLLLEEVENFLPSWSWKLGNYVRVSSCHCSTWQVVYPVELNGCIFSNLQNIEDSHVLSTGWTLRAIVVILRSHILADYTQDHFILNEAMIIQLCGPNIWVPRISN